MKYFSVLLTATLFFLILKNCANSQSYVALTFDDPNSFETPLMTPEQRNDAILNTLNDHGISSILFVCGRKVTGDTGKALISSWDKKGHRIANHSYNHKYYHSDKFTFEDFKNDFLKNDSLISPYSNYTKLFRFPFLKEGNTLVKRDSARALFDRTGYNEGYVSIDASEWYVNDLLTDTLKKNPSANIDIYKKIYIDHIIARSAYYDSLAEILTGRKVKHTLLLHHSLLNALFLDDLIKAYQDRGWNIISPEEAFRDEIYSRRPMILPAGESIIWAIAKETGKYDDVLRYPGEDSVYEEEEFRKRIESGF